MSNISVLNDYGWLWSRPETCGSLLSHPGLNWLKPTDNQAAGSLHGPHLTLSATYHGHRTCLDLVLIHGVSFLWVPPLHQSWGPSDPWEEEEQDPLILVFPIVDKKLQGKKMQVCCYWYNRLCSSWLCISSLLLTRIDLWLVLYNRDSTEDESKLSKLRWSGPKLLFWE